MFVGKECVEERGERIEQDVFFSFFLLGCLGILDTNSAKAPMSASERRKEEKPPTIDTSST